MKCEDIVGWSNNPIYRPARFDYKSCNFESIYHSMKWKSISWPLTVILLAEIWDARDTQGYNCSIRCIQCALRRRVSELADFTETRSLRVNKTKRTDIDSVFTSIIRAINQVLAIFFTRSRRKDPQIYRFYHNFIWLCRRFTAAPGLLLFK